MSRCRFTELPEMAVDDAVGLSVVFVSHCWGASWGTLVAAVSDSIPSGSHVWIDVFAVRQWAGNEADLDFTAVIAQSTSVLLVSGGCQYRAIQRLKAIPSIPMNHLTLTVSYCSGE